MAITEYCYKDPIYIGRDRDTLLSAAEAAGSHNIARMFRFIGALTILFRTPLPISVFHALCCDLRAVISDAVTGHRLPRHSIQVSLKAGTVSYNKAIIE